MNRETWKSLDRVVDQLERRGRRARRRFSPSALVLLAGLLLGYLLLGKLVPQVWPALLADDPARLLRGWPLLVWQASVLCQAHESALLAGVLAGPLVLLLATSRIGMLRPVAWLSAVAVVCVDAGIVASTLLACLQAAGVGN